MPVLLRKISRSSISMSKIESEFTTTKHLSRLIEQGKRPTVIVVDMQQTLLGRKIPGNPRMWQALKSTLTFAKSNHLPIIDVNFIPHHSKRVTSELTERGTLTIRELTEGDLSDLKSYPGYKWVEKKQTSSIPDTCVLDFMQQLESQTAIITGFSTDCCVFDTAKDLISAGKNVVISEEVTTRNVFLGKKKFPEGIDNFNSLQSEHTDRVELVRIIKLPESRKS